MASSLSNVINYCKTINGSLGFNDTKTQFINSMVQDYNEAHENAIYRFDVLINTIDAKDIYVNNSETTIKGVIDTSKKQTADTEIEQTIQVYPNQIKRGDYIKFKMNDTDELRTYLVKSKVDKKSSYDEAVFEECNYTLKWMYKENVHKTPCIITNQTKYTLGTDSVGGGNSIIEGDSRYQIELSYNEETKNITTGQRFIFNGNAWRVTQVDYVSNKGILSILLGQTAINYEVDNLDLEIANYKIVNHTYTYNIPTSFEVSKDNDYTLVYSIKDEIGKDVDYNLVSISTTNTSLVQLTNTNGVITIKGLDVGIGSIKLTATLSSETKDFNIPFEVKETVVDQVNYTTKWSSTGTTLKTYVASTAQCTKYINGVEQDGLVISYEIDSVGQSLVNTSKIAITQPSSSSVQIRNKSVSSTTTFVINIKDSSDNTLIVSQVITLTGM